MNTRNIYRIFNNIGKELTNQIIETTKPQAVTVIIFAFYVLLWFDFTFDWSLQNNKHSRNKFLVFTIIVIVIFFS